eukprot:EG_transcript_649
MSHKGTRKRHQNRKTDSPQLPEINERANLTTSENPPAEESRSSTNSVAVIGAGVSGLSAAYILHRAGYEVTLYESETRCGGHAWTVGDGPDAVDIGFQVFNLTTYPLLVALFRELEVDTEESSMTFSNSGGHWEWSSEGLSTIFPSPKSFLDRDHVAMVADIFKFGRHAPTVLSDPAYAAMTMKDYLRKHNYCNRFMTSYIGPMLSAIWSVPGSTALEMPIRSVVQFYVNHHLMSTVTPRPTWRVVRGRSHKYVEAIIQRLSDVKSGVEITAAKRDASGVTLTDINGNQYRHSAVIFATHAPDTLRILGEDAREDERAVLGGVRYQDNLCVLHNDPAYMPSDPRVWASWNFIGDWTGPASSTEERGNSKGSEASVCCTYWLNRLQNLPSTLGHRFVTLNPHKPVPPSAVMGQWVMAHPVLDHIAVVSQELLPSIQGKYRTYYAGAWTRYGFHEDGILSAVNVATLMGAKMPWKVTFTPDPVPSIPSYVGFHLFNAFAKSAIQKGHLRLLLPDGAERRYGPPASPLQAICRVWDWQFFPKLASGSDIALGEAFMADLFDTDGEASRFADVLIANQNHFMEKLWMLGPINYIMETLNWLNHLLLVRNTLSLAAANIKAHYDQGNDMFRTFMDKSMLYSSGLHWETDAEEEEWLWGSKRDAELRTEEGDGLYDAQLRKLDAILSAAEIKPGNLVLEVGCGWGECAIRGVTQYRCKWVGLTLSHEQKVEADARVKKLGLEDAITILVMDYRNLLDHYPPGSFDAIVSIEMMEAIGHSNFDNFFRTMQRALKPGGKLMVQVITLPHERYAAYCKSSDFIRKHIFPGGHLPSVETLKEFSTKNGLVLDQCRDIGPHYTVTLRAWRTRFVEQYDRVIELGYDRTFIRKFIWYFAICESSFRAKMIGNHHLRWAKPASGPVDPTAGSSPLKRSLKDASALPLHSGLYEGVVRHTRRQVEGLSPAENVFSYRVMMAYLDLGELDRVFAGRWFWGVDRLAPISFNRADHYGPKDTPLDVCVRDAVERETGRRPHGPITMLTNLRYMGYCINPITVYYCWAEGRSALEAVALHVTNTPWREEILYVLPAQGKVSKDGAFTTLFPKKMHVSPFLGMEYEYKLVAELPGQSISVVLENHHKPSDEKSSDQPREVPFRASAHLSRREITTWTLCRFLCLVPLMTWQVQFWIHYQAVILAFKRVQMFEVEHSNYTLYGSPTARFVVDWLKNIAIFIGAARD